MAGRSGSGEEIDASMVWMRGAPKAQMQFLAKELEVEFGPMKIFRIREGAKTSFEKDAGHSMDDAKGESTL